jgi:hypothetical protein
MRAGIVVAGIRASSGPMIVSVSDPDRLVDLVLFLRNSGFPFAQRLHGGTAKLFTDDEARVREAIALWERESGVRAEILG